MPAANDQHAPQPQLKKRIIVCCDGTWMDSDATVQVPSNVTRIARSIKPMGHDSEGHPIQQVVFYQNGVGTGDNSFYNTYIGGATGDGLAMHIREAYSFICLNYQDGDEIFLLGFSRGAFTARSISSLIREVGLLTPSGLDYFIQIFEDWEYQEKYKQGWRTKYPQEPWPGHCPPVSAPDYQRKLLELELTRPGQEGHGMSRAAIPIKAVAVWDTVGGLGIPMIGLLPQPPSTDFSFVDTKVEENIEYAFQALALDEHRRSYSPTIWEKPAEQVYPRVLRQCWFPGVHSDVGGSYPDTDLANLTLCWMVSQLDPLITFSHDYLWRQVRLSIEMHETPDPNTKPVTSKAHDNRSVSRAMTMRDDVRQWGLGKIHDSMTLFFRIGGSRVRTPNQYTRLGSVTQHGTLWWMANKIIHLIGRKLGLYREKLQPKLQGTNETVHSSVRIRMGKKGLGYNDKGIYSSEALMGWKMHGTETEPDTPIQQSMPGAPGAMKDVVWKKRARVMDEQGHEKDELLEMPEDKLGDFEKKILGLWPEIRKDFASIRPGGHDQVIGRASTYPVAGTAPTLLTPGPDGSRR